MSRRKALALLALALMAAALYVADARYCVIQTAPVVSHEALGWPDAAVRCVVDPGAARNLLAGIVHVRTGVPKLLLRAVLPREAALFAEPDMNSGEARLLVFVNPRRLGPLLARWSRGARLEEQAPFVRWASPGLVARGRGVLTLEGTLPLDPVALAVARSAWSAPGTGTGGSVETGHLLDGEADARGGGAFALFVTLASKLADTPPPFTPEALAEYLQVVSEIHVTADVVSADEVQMLCAFRLFPDADEGKAASLAFLTDVISSQGNGALQEATGVSVSSETSRENGTLTWTLSLTGLQKLQEGEAERNKP